MLVEAKIAPEYEDMREKWFGVWDNEKTHKPYHTGVYLSGFNFNHYLDPSLDYKHSYPVLGDIVFRMEGQEVGSLNCYGVCDNYKQWWRKYRKAVSVPDRKFVVAFTPVDNDGDDSGWRWHKWGPYIGKHKNRGEYLSDTPEIKRVYCFHVHEIGE